MTKSELFARLIVLGWKEYGVNNKIKPQMDVGNRYYRQGDHKIHTNSSVNGTSRTVRMADKFGSWDTYLLNEAWDIITNDKE